MVNFFSLCEYFSRDKESKKTNMKKPNLILIGPPGSGKGTFTQTLKKFDYVSLSTGNLLREIIEENSNLGIKCKTFINKGKLVPDDIIFNLIDQKIKFFLKDENPFVLDGFPQSFKQYQYILDLLKKEKMKEDVWFLEFIIDNNKAIERMKSRLFCLECHQIYNKNTNPPHKKYICDICQTTLSIRSTDNQADAQKRLDLYYKITKPILSLAKKEFKYLRINSNFEYNDMLYINFILHMF